MTLVALQAPWPAAPHRADKAAAAAQAPDQVQPVAALPDRPTQGAQSGMPGFRDHARDAFEQQNRSGYPAAQPDDTGPQPFPALRFADPLPDLPEMDLPGKASAYQAALGVLRGQDRA